MTCNVKNLLEFGVFCEFNQTFTMASYPCLANAFRCYFEDSNFDFYTNPCQISLVWWTLLQREIGKMENPKSYLKSFWHRRSCVIRNSCKDKSCTRNTLSQKSHEAVFIYHEFKDTCNNNNNIYLYCANLTIQFSNAPYN